MFGALERERGGNSRSRCRKNHVGKTFGRKGVGREIGLDLSTKIYLVG